MLEAPQAWLVRARWLVLAAAAVALAAAGVLRLVPRASLLPLGAGVVFLAAANLGFQRRLPKATNVRGFLLAQVACDLSLITYVLRYAGDLRHPLYVLYAFHVILAGILLAPRDAWLVAAGVIVLGGLAGAGEAGAAPRVVWEGGLSFAMLVFGAAFLTTSIMRRLRESQAALLRQERMSSLGRLVAYIAHETANPIGVISMRAKLLKGGAGADPEVLAESLEVIDRQADQVNQVMRSLLGYAKPQRCPGAEADLNRSLDEALLIAGGRLRRAGIAVERELAPRLPPARAACGEAVHVFLNLINNAADAMPRGGRLRVATRADGGWVEAEVSDTGTGIPADDLARVFEPFFTTKPADGGTGLGLPICRTLVRACGGDIAVESVPGQGSTFRVRLPAREAAPA